MKTTNKKGSKGCKTQLFRWLNISGKLLLIMITMLNFESLQAQKANQTITISEPQFADPLIRKWASEYAKSNSGITFKFVKYASQNEVADLKITVNKTVTKETDKIKSQVNVGRLAVLPVANVKNALVSKQMKNGIRQEELKNYSCNQILKKNKQKNLFIRFIRKPNNRKLQMY